METMKTETTGTIEYTPESSVEKKKYQYQLQGVPQQGHKSVVYHVWSGDEKLYVLKQARKEYAEAFLSQARNLLDHQLKYFVKVVGIGKSPGAGGMLPTLLMEDGGIDLEQLTRNPTVGIDAEVWKAFGYKVILTTLAALQDGLQFSPPVTHGDINPKNVLSGMRRIASDPNNAASLSELESELINCPVKLCDRIIHPEFSTLYAPRDPNTLHLRYFADPATEDLSPERDLGAVVRMFAWLEKRKVKLLDEKRVLQERLGISFEYEKTSLANIKQALLETAEREGYFVEWDNFPRVLRPSDKFIQEWGSKAWNDFRLDSSVKAMYTMNSKTSYTELKRRAALMEGGRQTNLLQELFTQKIREIAEGYLAGYTSLVQERTKIDKKIMDTHKGKDRSVTKITNLTQKGTDIIQKRSMVDLEVLGNPQDTTKKSEQASLQQEYATVTTEIQKEKETLKKIEIMEAGHQQELLQRDVGNHECVLKYIATTCLPEIEAVSRDNLQEKIKRSGLV